MAKILEQKLGLTILSENGTSWEDFYNSLPKGEETVSEKTFEQVIREDLKRRLHKVAARMSALSVWAQMPESRFHGCRNFNLNHSETWLARYEVKEISFISGRRVHIPNWGSALGSLLFFLAIKYPEELRILGTLRNSREVRRILEMGFAFEKPIVRNKQLALQKTKETSRVIHSLQWLALMFDFDLQTILAKCSNRVITHSVYTLPPRKPVSESKKPEKSKPPKQRKWQDPVCPFNTCAPLSVQVIAPRATKVVIKVKSSQKSVAAPRNPLSGSNIWTTWGATAPIHYVVMADGLCEIFRHGLPHGHRIARAESEDAWRGFGYLVRDYGRYGGISSEDYLD